MDWHIRKKYRLNPLTNQDQPYSPDYYRKITASGGDSRVVDQHPEALNVRAIQIMLHEQTNYNRLCYQGFYQQPQEIIDLALTTWYSDIARRFPKYRNACEIECRRHQIKARNIRTGTWLPPRPNQGPQ